MKTIFRTNPQKEFTILANRMLRDRTLSFKARGMLAMIMSHNESWEVHASWISEQGTEGREAISSGLTELEAKGYVSYQPTTDETTGQFTGGMWTFSDTPAAEAQRTNRTRWREKQAAAEAEKGQEKAHGNRGHAPVPTGSRSTAVTTANRDTGSRDTATPQHGNPSAKKKEDDQKDDQKKENQPPADEKPDDLMGWREIGLALLAAFGRPAYDIDRLGCDESHWLLQVDKQCTREELATLVRAIKKPQDGNNRLLISRAMKMRTLLPNFREQIGIALQICPPPKPKPAPAPPKPAPPEQTPEEAAAARAEATRAISDLKRKLRGGPPVPDPELELAGAAAREEN